MGESINYIFMPRERDMGEPRERDMGKLFVGKIHPELFFLHPCVITLISIQLVGKLSGKTAS